MAKGCQIYFGKVDAAEEYFARFGYIRPEEVALPDFLQELTGDPKVFYNPKQDPRQHSEEESKIRGTYEDLAACWKSSEEYMNLGQTLWSKFGIDHSQG